VGNQLGDAIALATAWLEGDMEAWQLLAEEAVKRGPTDVLGQFSQVVTTLAEAIAAQSPGYAPHTVLQHLALDVERGHDSDPGAT
jgi:hypothetical protein